MKKDFKSKFGLRIKELRLANKYTQEALAEKLEMERSNLAKIEAGNHFPSAENIEKFIKIFNLEPNELFSFAHHKDRKTLIKEIIQTINDFNDDKVKYIHKSIMNLKVFK